MFFLNLLIFIIKCLDLIRTNNSQTSEELSQATGVEHDGGRKQKEGRACVFKEIVDCRPFKGKGNTFVFKWRTAETGEEGYKRCQSIQLSSSSLFFMSFIFLLFF